MSLGLYRDHHVPRAVAQGLRRRGVDLVTAGEEGTKREPDTNLLAIATELGRVLVTNDRGFTIIGSEWQQLGRAYAGIAYVRRQRIPHGKLIEDLLLIAEVYGPGDMANRIEYLPL